MESILSLGVDRQTVLIALGGGVIGDLVGYAAGCYAVLILFKYPPPYWHKSTAQLGAKQASMHALVKI